MLGHLEVELLSVVVVLLGALILITVLFLRTLSKMADANDRTHQRWDSLLRSNLDRMMAPDFPTFKAYALSEASPMGAVEYEDDEEALQPQMVPDGVHTLRELITESGGGGGSAA